MEKITQKAIPKLGYPLNNDFNGKQQEGVGLYQVTINKGKRCSSAKAFLTPEVLARPNLKIFTNAQVSKLLINDSKHITGLQFVNNQYLSENSSASELADNTKVIEAPEVILSAGAINSPQILLLSGFLFLLFPFLPSFSLSPLPSLSSLPPLLSFPLPPLPSPSFSPSPQILLVRFLISQFPHSSFPFPSSSPFSPSPPLPPLPFLPSFPLPFPLPFLPSDFPLCITKSPFVLYLLECIV